MGIFRRAALYLVRKKGKATLLFLIFFLVSGLLLICFSILDGTEQASRDLRANIGAAFYIRPYVQMILEDGVLSEGTAPVISEQSIMAMPRANSFTSCRVPGTMKPATWVR